MFKRSYSHFLIAIAVLLSACTVLPHSARAAESPNFIIIYADDLGYGDLACYGHPTIRTPNLDRMAAEGQKWTQFYVAAAVCTPSRAGLMTGRLPIRNGMCSTRRRVLFPDSKGGMPAGEFTIAEMLKEQGYATGIVGKWHLGHLPEYLPLRHGFDYYFGIPYSNDMDRVKGPYDREEPDFTRFNVPLIENDTTVERPADQNTITKRYTDKAVQFIKDHKHGPFFLYMPHSMPHIPLFASKDFRHSSRRGFYGDVIEEIDWSVGQVRKALEEAGIADNTIVMFSSDNGPWLPFREHGGSAGLLRGGKGGTFEGGMRVPFVVWGPGHIKSGIVRDFGSTLDLLPTLAAMAGGDVPGDRTMDGFDLSATLLEKEPGPRDHMIYYRGTEVFAVRLGDYKVHFITQGAFGQDGPRQVHDTPLLFNLEIDPSEQYDIAEKHPEVIEQITSFLEKHKVGVEEVENQLEKR